MGILNKNNVSYRVEKKAANYKVIVKAKTELGSEYINSMLINLTELEIFKEEGIQFYRSIPADCIAAVTEDVTKL